MPIRRRWLSLLTCLEEVGQHIDLRVFGQAKVAQPVVADRAEPRAELDELARDDQQQIIEPCPVNLLEVLPPFMGRDTSRPCTHAPITCFNGSISIVISGPPRQKRGAPMSYMYQLWLMIYLSSIHAMADGPLWGRGRQVIVLLLGSCATLTTKGKTCLPTPPGPAIDILPLGNALQPPFLL